VLFFDKIKKKSAFIFFAIALDEKALLSPPGLFHSLKLVVNFWRKVMFFPP
jgi:hypothetical protein